MCPTSEFQKAAADWIERQFGCILAEPMALGGCGVSPRSVDIAILVAQHIEQQDRVTMTDIDVIARQCESTFDAAMIVVNTLCASLLGQVFLRDGTAAVSPNELHELLRKYASPDRVEAEGAKEEMQKILVTWQRQAATQSMAGPSDSFHGQPPA